MPHKKRKCVSCKEFKSVEEGNITPSGFICSGECAIEYAKKKFKKAHTQRKREFKKSDKPYRMKQAQAAFNAYIRARDENEPCISCQRHHQGQYHAGHYRTTGACPELRFEELNCHKQCQPCNNHLSGNIVEYRINLIKKIGIEQVEWLESKHEPKRYTAEDLLEIERRYKQKLKDLLKSRQLNQPEI